MLIDLSDILKQGREAVEFCVTLKPEDCSAMSSGDYTVTGVSDFILLVSCTQHALTVTGNTVVEAVTGCGRCLKDTMVSVPVSLQLEFGVSEETVLDDDEDPCQAFSDGILDLNELLSEEILFGFPSKILCKPDCRGICPNCGADLNVSDCGCDRVVRDPRMQKFLDVFNG